MAVRTYAKQAGYGTKYNHVLMPPLREQRQRMDKRFTAPFTVLRLLTPLKMSYEAAKKRAEPYTKIVEELPQDAARHRGPVEERSGREAKGVCFRLC